MTFDLEREARCRKLDYERLRFDADRERLADTPITGPRQSPFIAKTRLAIATELIRIAHALARQIAGQQRI